MTRGLDYGKLATPGSPILTAWKADRERQRREEASQAELRKAMAAMRGHALRSAPRRAKAAPTYIPEPAFGIVSGERAFTAGESDRITSGWTSYSTGINADLERALPTLRARSRDWAVNTDSGRRYVQLVKDNVIGSKAPRLQVRATLANSDTLDEIANTAIETHWERWCERGLCDVSGMLSFTDLCRTNVAAAGRDGEFLGRHVRDRNLPYGYALQALDVDRLYPGNGALSQAQGDNLIRLGVEINKYGRPQAYHLYSAHPGDGAAGLAPKPMAERVPASEIWHGYVVERPEQVRGYPWTASILKSANILDKYKEYALVAAKIGAGKMGFYITDKDAPSGEPPDFEDYKDATGALVQDVEAGMLEALPPGVTFETFDPDYPHQNFGSFVTTGQHGIAAGLNVAHHNLTGDMTGVNYSSARIAELAEREHWRGLQLWFIEVFVRPVFLEWLRMALLTRSITLPSGAALPADRFDKFAQAASFQPRGWAWVDPEADIKASSMAIANNLRSHRQITDEQGVDLDTVLTDEAAFYARRKALGLPDLATQTHVLNTPAAAPAPAPKEAP
jgi:lambda family phage portal protein